MIHFASKEGLIASWVGSGRAKRKGEHLPPFWFHRLEPHPVLEGHLLGRLPNGFSIAHGPLVRGVWNVRDGTGRIHAFRSVDEVNRLVKENEG